MTYTLEVTNSARREIRKLPKDILMQIKKSFEKLAFEPRPSNVKKLKGIKAEVYRVRVENYRIVYEIRDKKLVIIVIAVAHRKDIYSKKNIKRIESTLN